MCSLLEKNFHSKSFCFLFNGVKRYSLTLFKEESDCDICFSALRFGEKEILCKMMLTFTQMTVDFFSFQKKDWQPLIGNRKHAFAYACFTKTKHSICCNATEAELTDRYFSMSIK